MIKAITLDSAKFERFLQTYRQQLPFAMAVALNRTADDANAALRRHLDDAFTIRAPGLLRYVAPLDIPRPNRARKDRLSVILETDRIGRIFNPFETGVPKVTRANEHLIIPSENLRPSPNTVIARTLYPTNLGLTAKRDPAGTHYYALGRGAKAKKLTPYHKGATGKWTIKGRRRTFALDPNYQQDIAPEDAGIYQRVGLGRDGIRLLWHYADRVERPSTLQFYDTLNRTFDARIKSNLEGAIAFALRTAK
jgi:hypothetical protein